MGLRPKCKFSRPAFQHNRELIIPLPPPSLANPVQPHSSNTFASPPSRSKEADTKRRLFFFRTTKVILSDLTRWRCPKRKPSSNQPFLEAFLPSQRGRLRQPNTETYQRQGKKHNYSNHNRSGRNSNAPLLPRTGSVLQDRHLIIYVCHNPPA